MTRAELMTVLSGLEAVRLRGLYFSETQRLSLSGVGLEEASDTGSGRRAHTVEMCACPPDYTGDSCQVGNSPVRTSAPGTPGRCPAPLVWDARSTHRSQRGCGFCLAWTTLRY